MKNTLDLGNENNLAYELEDDKTSLMSFKEGMGNEPQPSKDNLRYKSYLKKVEQKKNNAIL